MRVTWRDGVTTLATAGAIVLERAYFHNWNWPLIDDVRWTIGGLAALVVVSFVFGYVLDSSRNTTWTVIAGLIGLAALVFTGLGLVYAASDYAVMLMLSAVVFWIASIIEHIVVPSTASHGHGHGYA